MARRMEVEVEGTRARFVLLDDLAPKSAAALWDSLPIESTLTHGKLSGDACSFDVRSGPLAALPEQPEFGVASIYQGYMVLAPSPARGGAELLVSYGLAESRTATGRRYVTPVAEVEGDGSAIFAALKRTHTRGETRVAVRRVES